MHRPGCFGKRARNQQNEQIGAIQAQLATNDEHYRHLREGFNELQGGIEIVSDSDMLEEAESEDRGVDETVEPQTNLTQCVETFCNELNACLMRHDYPMAAQFQNCIVSILDAIHGTLPMPRGARAALFTGLGDQLEEWPIRAETICLTWLRDMMPTVGNCVRWHSWIEVCIFSFLKEVFSLVGA